MRRRSFPTLDDEHTRHMRRRSGRGEPCPRCMGCAFAGTDYDSEDLSMPDRVATACPWSSLRFACALGRRGASQTQSASAG